MKRWIIRLTTALLALAIGIATSVGWSVLSHMTIVNNVHQIDHDSVGGPPIVIFEGTLLAYSPHVGVHCGLLYVHQVAKYRVDKVIEGEYGAEEIVVDHPACEGDVFKKLPIGSQVTVVVSVQQSYSTITMEKGIRETEHPAVFYIAVRDPVIPGAK
jgi:hypothetical protein